MKLFEGVRMELENVYVEVKKHKFIMYKGPLEWLEGVSVREFLERTLQNQFQDGDHVTVKFRFQDASK